MRWWLKEGCVKESGDVSRESRKAGMWRGYVGRGNVMREVERGKRDVRR